jgi:hypothetical protein
MPKSRVPMNTARTSADAVYPAMMAVRRRVASIMRRPKPLS